MAGWIRGAMEGLGGAMEKTGAAMVQSTLDEGRQARLEELRAANQSMRDDKLMAHQSEEAGKSRDLTREQGALTREHAATLQKNSLEAAAEEHRLTREHQSNEGARTRAHQSAEGDKTRELQREGLGIQRASLGIQAQGAALDREIKQIQIKNAKDLETLRDQYRTETDPDRKAQLADMMRVLTGKDKDKYLPVPLKDDMGNITGYEIFDTIRGKFIDSGKSPAAKAGKPGERPPLDQFFSRGGKGPSKEAERKAPPVGIISRQMAVPGSGPVAGGIADRIQNPSRYRTESLEEDEEQRYQN